MTSSGAGDRVRRVSYVVNADDFGLNESVNDAIVASFEQGLISSTTMLVNLPGFSHAVDQTGAHALHGKVGVHLNLTEGQPLTSAIGKCRRFVEHGEFRFVLPISALRLDAAEYDAVRTEWRAQIARCVAHGIQPTHLDSHHHVHTVWPLLSITIGLAREFGIPAVRITRNVGPKPSFPKQVYKRIMNERLRRTGLALSRYFGSADDLLPVHHALTGPIEVMVHPVIEDGVLLDLVEGNPRKVTRLEEVIGALGIVGSAVSYRELGKA